MKKTEELLKLIDEAISDIDNIVGFLDYRINNIPDKRRQTSVFEYIKDKPLEEFLSALDRVEDFIKEEESLSDIYGPGWKKRDWKYWRSMTAGELCNVLISLEKAEAKLSRNNKGSIGYRKGKAEAKAANREKRRLEKLINASVFDYKAHKPKYITCKPVTVERPERPKRSLPTKDRDTEGFIVI